jgi:hypothetical protein
MDGNVAREFIDERWDRGNLKRRTVSENESLPPPPTLETYEGKIIQDEADQACLASSDGWNS